MNLKISFFIGINSLPKRRRVEDTENSAKPQTTVPVVLRKPSAIFSWNESHWN